MSHVVVDTDVVSFLFKNDSRAERYRNYLLGTEPVISFMTIAELYRWTAIRNWGTGRRARLEAYLCEFITYPYDQALCQAWADVSVSAQRQGRPIETADAWVAAVAVLFEVPLITHNVNDYKGVMGLEIISSPDA